MVYPAGFVWLFDALRRLTNDGSNIAAAQLWFAAMYVASQAVVFALYICSQVRSTSNKRKFRLYCIDYELTGTVFLVEHSLASISASWRHLWLLESSSHIVQLHDAFQAARVFVTSSASHARLSNYLACSSHDDKHFSEIPYTICCNLIRPRHRTGGKPQLFHCSSCNLHVFLDCNK